MFRWVVFLSCALGCSASPEAMDLPDRGPSDGGREETRADASTDASADAPWDVENTPDAVVDGSAPDADPSLGSRCTQTPTEIRCPRETMQIRTGLTALTARDVHYQLPLGEPPPDGFPVAIMFQGSLFSAGFNWLGFKPGPFGVYNQANVLKSLLDAGYAVITPEARLEGSTFWDTNIPPYSVAWEQSGDHRLMVRLFAAIENGDFGPLDARRLYATGISSGGYMTSRMAVSYAGRFRALAVHSGSYATCGGAACLVPRDLPNDHPPTLFLHGVLDAVVPIFTMEAYRDRLADQGIEVDVVTVTAAGHEWIDPAPESIVDWFRRYP
ncbi:MAG: plasmid partitioning protein [Myxococcota bacterium]